MPQPANLLHLPDSADGIARAAALLRAGGLVAFATDTVFGLGADARNSDAVARLFAAKRRPLGKPLIVLVADIQAARTLARLTPTAERLASAFWPGALTLIAPLRENTGLAPLVTGAGHSIGLRVPAHPAAQRLLATFGGPLATASANISGALSPTRAQHVTQELANRIDALLYPSENPEGIESTIIDVQHAPTLLRLGALPPEAIETCLATPLAQVKPPRTTPTLRLRLNATDKRPGEALLGFGNTANADLDLSPAGDMREAAANLFEMLRQLTTRGAHTIAVAPIPQTGLGRALNDRLRRLAG